MRVTLFAYFNTALNPYILLFKEALESQGLQVDITRDFDLNWLVTKGKTFDVIHLHTMLATYTPFRRNTRFGLFNKLMNNRFVMPLRGIVRLACFSMALLLAKLQGKTIVYTVHDLKPHNKRSWPFVVLNRLAHYVVLVLSNRVHAHNHYARSFLETTYSKKDGITVVPHGNYIGCYPNQISQAEARRQLDLPEEAFVYLFLGLLRPYKGLEDLVDAFKKLEWSLGRLLIVGRVFDPWYQPEVLSLARNNQTVKVIPEFIPNEDIQLYMNACNVCVLPYKDITTSGAALLALSFGRPLIAPAIASFPELITPETGILYDPSQPNALVSALQRARQHAWSEAKIFDYTHQFDWSKLAPQLAGLYKKNLTDNGRQGISKEVRSAEEK
jgi:glycosyltransferase involved in cell wall biosynthesis